MAKLFYEPLNKFVWTDVKTFHLRNQYNEMLSKVLKEYFTAQYKNAPYPRFLDSSFCLTLSKFDDSCNCGSGPILLSASQNGTSASDPNKNKLDTAQKDFDIAASAVEFAKINLELAVKSVKLSLEAIPAPDPNQVKLKKKLADIDALEESKRVEEYKKIPELQTLAAYTELVDEENNFGQKQRELKQAEQAYYTPIIEAQQKFEKAKKLVEFAKINFKNDGSRENELRLKSAQENLNKEMANGKQNISNPYDCHDHESTEFCLPHFFYKRVMSISQIPAGQTIDLSFETNGLTVGAVVWLYYYERMGIFKILGALMDDFNYRGKYTLSGSRKDSNGTDISYSVLMDMICTLHRLGISSNLRDRVCTYQRVLGVSIENKLGIESEQNKGFMQSFNKLIDYMLEYYKTKQLAQAIQSQNGTTQPRSSVATQTSIRDTMNVLKQQFEPLEYGRNQINTFIAIATVHATICLVNMVKTEIGIPAQYEKPEEFIPAAYDILVAKRAPTLNESNRFIIYDNCASYGYRLLTDIETVDLNQLTTIASGSTLDTWLNDVEGWVEGYRNAYSVLPEKAAAIV